MQAIPPTEPIKLGLGRKALAHVLGLLAAAARTQSQAFPPAHARPRRVVLLEPYGLGDAISLVPLVRGLLDRQWRVTVCARAAWRDVFPGEVEWVDCRLPWTAYDDRKKYRFSSLTGPTMRVFLRNLRQAAEGSIGVDTRGDARSLILLWLARCHRVFTLDHYLGYNLATPQWAGERVAYDGALRRWQSNLRFLAALDPEADINRCQLDLRGHWPLTPSSLDEPPTIGLIPLAPWHGKLWPPELWRTTIRLLEQKGWRMRGLAGPGQLEATAGALDLPAREVASCENLASWAQHLSNVKAVISVDTGPMHLADALHVPLVVLYGASTLPLWAPSSPTSWVLHRQGDADHFPVHPTGRAIPQGQEWMRRHTPEHVIAAVDKVMAGQAVS